MSGSFQVDHEQLAQCGQRVSAMSSQAQSLHGRATSAEVPSRSWGLLGELTTHSRYSEMQNQLTDHLGAMTTGLHNAGSKISGAAELYKSTDEEHKRELDRIGEKENSKPPEHTGGGPTESGTGGDTGTGGGGGHHPSGGHGPVGAGEKPHPPVSNPTGAQTAAADAAKAAAARAAAEAAARAGEHVAGGTSPTHGKITVEVEGGGPVTVEVTGEAAEEVEVKGDIRQAGGATEHLDVHARTDASGHAKVALKGDDQFQHLSGTLDVPAAEQRKGQRA
ncbi:hypothetical protein GCM10010174_08090 [Kutzneria viridogrisea]|uniref:Uncharacterized protein YukE n=1 Tax=Kutzneria viridogrisea TaxID=47990 RepID=A0ABR6BY97_9PSEU|nr:uncharacterized protein YukE [Kutzneria viridogrisea]